MIVSCLLFDQVDWDAVAKAGKYKGVKSAKDQWWKLKNKKLSGIPNGGSFASTVPAPAASPAVKSSKRRKRNVKDVGDDEKIEAAAEEQDDQIKGEEE